MVYLTSKIPSFRDVCNFARELRDEDRRELETVSQLAAVESLLNTVVSAAECITLRGDGKIVCMVGVQPSPHEGWGAVWLVATPAVSQYRRSVLKACRVLRDRWSSGYPNGVHAFVDSRNDLHLRWLGMLDFQHGETAMIHGIPFIYTQYGR